MFGHNLIESLFLRVRPAKYDLFFEKLSYYVTFLVYLACVSVISVKLYGGSPVECAVPKDISVGYKSFADTFCASQATYFVPWQSTNIQDPETRNKLRNFNNYYAYTPLFLLLMALTCMIPFAFWSIARTFKGPKMNRLLQKVAVTSEAQEKDLPPAILSIVASINEFAPQRHSKCNSSNFLIVGYLASKFVYVLTSVGQIWLTQMFLGESSWIWGATAVSDLWNGFDWTVTGRFPRISFCDFKTVDGMSERINTVQCAFSISHLNEIVFIFLWFWTVLVLATSVLSLAYWSLLLTPCFRESYLWQVIQEHEDFTATGQDIIRVKKDFALFSENIVKGDMYLILRFICLHFGDNISKRLVCQYCRDFQGA